MLPSCYLAALLKRGVSEVELKEFDLRHSLSGLLSELPKLGPSVSSDAEVLVTRTTSALTSLSFDSMEEEYSRLRSSQSSRQSGNARAGSALRARLINVQNKR